MKKTLNILSITLVLLLTPFLTLAVDSTDPQDYLFYDTMENASTEATYYVDSNNHLAYSASQAYAGTNSLEINYAMDVNHLAYIGTDTDGFTTTEASNPYCMDFQYYQQAHGTAGNQEQGVWKGDSWVSIAVFLDSDSGGDDNVQLFNSTEGYINIGLAGALDTWKYYKMCFYDGYDPSGETSMAIWNATDLMYNITGITRSTLNRTNLINRLPGPGTYNYYDNIRVWNMTDNGEFPPQSAAPPINEGLQNITVYKVIVNDNGGTASGASFPLYINATLVTNASTTNLSVGTYQISETGTFGYALTYSGDCDASGLLVLPANTSATCTLTNNDLQGSLTVTKVVINDNNGTNVVGDFALFVNASGVTSGVSTNRNAGTYLVSETPLAGYTGTITGDCTSGGVVTVGLNQSRACTITNDDNAPTPPTPAEEFDTEFTSTFNAVVALFVILLLFSIGFVWADKKGYVSNDVRKYFWSIIGLVITVIILGLLFV